MKKKSLLAVVLALVLAAALCACSSSAAATTTAAPETTVAEETTAAAEETTAAATEDSASGLSYNVYTTSEDYTVYDVTMTYQAGYQEYQTNPDGGMLTIHAGVGFLDPFGEGDYYAGLMFPESFEVPESIYVSDWMDANFSCSLFVVYHTPDGDIYAWDGIFGANAKDLSNYMEDPQAYYTADEVDGSTPTRSDALINIVVGGTGIFQGAYGVLTGSTSGGGVYGTPGAITLPQTLFKSMEGHIVVPNNCETLSLVQSTQELSDDTSSFNALPNNYAMVPLTLRYQSGSLEQSETKGAGVGTFLPFNGDALTTSSGNDLPEAANFKASDYVNENWIKVYGEPTFTVLHVNDGTVSGDVYGYKFNYGKILDTSSAISETGEQDAVFMILIGGTGDFTGITGYLEGRDIRCNPEGRAAATYSNDVDLVNMTWAEGWMKVPATSAAAAYGNTIITDDE